jgi:hypothetical protein
LGQLSNLKFLHLKDNPGITVLPQELTTLTEMRVVEVNAEVATSEVYQAIKFVKGWGALG